MTFDLQNERKTCANRLVVKVLILSLGIENDKTRLAFNMLCSCKGNIGRASSFTFARVFELFAKCTSLAQ